MAHNPVNHHLRPLYRVIGFLAGAYLVVFGIVGLIQTSGEDATGANDKLILGQGGNLLLSIIMLAVGGIVVIATLLGRNLDAAADKYLGWGLLVFGTYGLAFSRTDANVFGQNIQTVIVTYIVGIVLITVSLYSKVAPAAQSGAPRQVREGRTA